jgi:glycosyltransferase involved in cell wall biosynthesis
LWILTPDAEEFAHLLTPISKEDYRIEFRPHESIGNLIHAADVGLLIRRRDLINSVASPVKFPEYLACGLPVIIGTEVGDYSTLVQKKRLGVLVDPEYPDSWDREIGHLLSLLNKDKSLRQRCREMARSLSWQSYKEKMQHEFGETI